MKTLKYIRYLRNPSLKFKRLTGNLSFKLFLGSTTIVKYLVVGTKILFLTIRKQNLAFQNTVTEMILLDSWT